ncbi:MAG: type II secretion system F family protein [Eubacteriales bacterium]
MDSKLLALTISSGLLVFGIALFVFSMVMRHQVVVGERIKALTDEQSNRIRTEEEKKEKKNRTRLPISKMFEEQLSTAGIHMRAEEFLLFWIFLIAAPAGLMVLFGAGIMPLIVVISVAIVMPPIFVRSRRKKQLALFEAQLGDALMLIGNCLRSGLTFQQAMGSIAKEMQDPIAKEFSRVVKEIQLGTGLESALENMLRRIDSQELMLTISAVQIQHQVGGNLMEVLQNISSTITDRQKLKEDIKVMTASGRMSGLIIGLLPVMIGGILMLVNGEYIQTFFTTKAGTIMLIVAGVMEFIGFLVIRKIINIKY